MKKRNMLLALLLAAVLCAGCMTAPAQDGEPGTFQKIDIPIVLADRQDVDCCYMDGEAGIFVVRDRNGASTGPIYDTQYFCLMDDFAVEKLFNINSERAIFSMIPYQDGILYVDLMYMPRSETTENYINWTLKWITEEQTISIAEGKIDYYLDVPRLFLLDGVPHYLWKAWDGSGMFGINRVEGTESIPAFTEKEYTIDHMPPLECNGKQYAFHVSREDDPYATVLIGDATGILYRCAMDKKITSYAINDSSFVCGLADETDPNKTEFSVLSMSLKDGKTETFPVDIPIWRFCGSGESFLAVDDNWHLLVVDTQAQKVEMLSRPQEVGDVPSTTYAMGDNQYYIRFSKSLGRGKRLYTHYILTIG